MDDTDIVTIVITKRLHRSCRAVLIVLQDMIMKDAELAVFDILMDSVGGESIAIGASIIIAPEAGRTGKPAGETVFYNEARNEEMLGEEGD
jgi:hypothetical protein